MSGVGMMLLSGGGDRVKISNATITDSLSSTASSTYQLTSAGVINSITNSSGTASLGNWVVPGTSASNYEALVTVTSGTLTTGTAGTWQALSTTRSWSRNRTTTGITIAVITVDIRLVGTTTVLTTASITLSAEFA
jgi:hypothetical protein